MKLIIPHPQLSWPWGKVDHGVRTTARPLAQQLVREEPHACPLDMVGLCVRTMALDRGWRLVLPHACPWGMVDLCARTMAPLLAQQPVREEPHACLLGMVGLCVRTTALDRGWRLVPPHACPWGMVDLDVRTMALARGARLQNGGMADHGVRTMALRWLRWPRWRWRLRL